MLKIFSSDKTPRNLEKFINNDDENSIITITGSGMDKKAEMGIGTLIIFIALLLAVAIAAGVLIQTSGSLQEDALTTGSEAKNQIATHISVTEVFGSDGSSGNITDFVVTTKLSPGSEDIKFGDLLVSIGSYDTSSTLSYRGVNGTDEKGAQGYETYYPQEIGMLSVYEDPISQNVAQVPVTLIVDLDEDGQNDTVEVCRYLTNCIGFLPNQSLDGQYLAFNLSSVGMIYVAMLKPDGTCCTDVRFLDRPFYGGELAISGYGRTYGTVLLTGLSDGSTQVQPEDINVYNDKQLLDDLDEDGLNDYVTFNRSHILFLQGDNVNASVALTTALDNKGAVQTVNTTIIDEDGEELGSVVLIGTTSTRWIVDDNLTFTINPRLIGTGYFSVEYLKEAVNHIDGNLQRGDVARLYFETAKQIGEDEEIWLRLIPKVGAPSNLILITPDVMVEKRVYLFP